VKVPAAFLHRCPLQAFRKF